MNRETRGNTGNQMQVGDRGQWASKTEYILVVAGNVVGLGNVWRFPYLCYKNGGGAFLVPYCLLLVICGIPLLETSVEQYTQEGFITCSRKLCPLVQGDVVGLGNVWRFPYLCYKNGGGAFLVPYCLFAVVVGIPLFLLESASGQYTQEGCITCWRKLCPLAQGIGYGHFVTKLYDFSYILIKAWALLYLMFSFTSQLPWASCDNTWNTVSCIGLRGWDSPSPNVTENRTMLTNTTSAATEFWERRVLGMSGGIEELGSVRWELALCLLACWVFCYFSIWKGVRSSGKIKENSAEDLGWEKRKMVKEGTTEELSTSEGTA